LVSHDSVAAKPYCCVKGAYCCKIKRNCCHNAAPVNLTQAVTQGPNAAPACCAKHAYCCSLRSRCCPKTKNADERSSALSKSDFYELVAASCCVKRAYCCKIRRPCCGSNAQAQVT
jgi:hypothetical protein